MAKTKTITLNGIKFRIALPSGRITSLPDASKLSRWIETGIVREKVTHVVADRYIVDWFVDLDQLPKR